MIDSVKAARNLDTRPQRRSTSIDGHSQGGQGALFADQIAPSYDGALVLRGVAAIAPVSNVDLFAPLIPGTAGPGLPGDGPVRPAGGRPDASTRSPCWPRPAKPEHRVLQTGCLNEILAAYAAADRRPSCWSAARCRPRWSPSWRTTTTPAQKRPERPHPAGPGHRRRGGAVRHHRRPAAHRAQRLHPAGHLRRARRAPPTTARSSQSDHPGRRLDRGPLRLTPPPPTPPWRHPGRTTPARDAAGTRTRGRSTLTIVGGRGCRSARVSGCFRFYGRPL